MPDEKYDISISESTLSASADTYLNHNTVTTHRTHNGSLLQGTCNSEVLCFCMHNYNYWDKKKKILRSLLCFSCSNQQLSLVYQHFISIIFLQSFRFTVLCSKLTYSLSINHRFSTENFWCLVLQHWEASWNTVHYSSVPG